MDRELDFWYNSSNSNGFSEFRKKKHFYVYWLLALNVPEWFVFSV